MRAAAALSAGTKPLTWANQFVALHTRLYMERHGALREDFGRFCIALRTNALRNPNAIFKEALTMDAYLNAGPNWDGWNAGRVLLQPCAHAACRKVIFWKAGVGIVTLGTTKCSSFGAECIVSFTPKYDTALAFLRKRGGHFAPGSRFLGAQVRAHVDDDLWLRNARHANRAARRMIDGLTAIAGIEPIHPTEGNEVLVAMPEHMTEALVAAGCTFQRDWRLHPRHNRFVCSWATADEEVDRMLDVCRAARHSSPVRA